MYLLFKIFEILSNRTVTNKMLNIFYHVYFTFTLFHQFYFETLKMEQTVIFIQNIFTFKAGAIKSFATRAEQQQ